LGDVYKRQAQQLMALCLQEHRITMGARQEWWGDLPLFDDTTEAILDHLITEGYFEPDGPFLHIGPEAERRFGRRYFSDLTAVFTAPPEFLVLAGRNEVGTVGTDLLTQEVDGPRVLLLGGRSWKVTHVDWDRRHCFVESADGGGQAKWSGMSGGVSYDITRGMRDVILGELPQGVEFTSRAAAALDGLRQTYADTAAAGRLIVRLPDDSSGRWWTWAGTAANRTLQASLPKLVDPRQRLDEKSVRLLPGISAAEFGDAIAAVEWRDPLVDASAIRGLKFSVALPLELAARTLGARIGDPGRARSVYSEERLLTRGH
ncbi:MAG: ATP-dependent helicase, partial [Mycobacterium sp.]|nr:ATP-dependent helicase [Mycobacterium sp.]